MHVHICVCILRIGMHFLLFFKRRSIADVEIDAYFIKNFIKTFESSNNKIFWNYVLSDKIEQEHNNLIINLLAKTSELSLLSYTDQK